MQNDRLTALVHYLVDRCDPASLGATKLNKALWFADREAHILLGHTITGRDYIKLENGPVPAGIGPVLGELKAAGAIVERRVRVIEHTRREFEAARPADVSKFSEQELALIDAVADFVCARSAREISDISHDEAWESFEIGEVIPVEVGSAAAFLAPISEDKLRWARHVSPVH
jgi:hypothetical protein